MGRAFTAFLARNPLDPLAAVGSTQQPRGVIHRG